MSHEIPVLGPRRENGRRHFVTDLKSAAMCGKKRPKAGWRPTEDASGNDVTSGKWSQCERCTRKLFGRMN